MLYIISVLLSVAAVSATYTPFSTLQPMFTNVTNTVVNSANHWGSKIKAPYESNIFFENMIMGTGTQPVNFYPYILGIEQKVGLGIGVPTHLQSSSAAVKTQYFRNITLTVAEGNFDRHRITSFDQLSLTLEFLHSQGNITFPLLRGNGLLTAEFQNLSPRFYVGSAIQSITLPIGSNHTSQEKVRSNRFILNLENGEHWILYTSTPVTLNFTSQVINFQNPFNGTLRLAHLGQNISNSLIFDKYRDAIPTSGAIQYSITGNEATITYTYTVRSLSGNNECGSQTKDPLIFALPHHVETLQNAKYVDLNHLTIRGNAVGVSGKMWTMKEQLTPLVWDAPRNYTKAKWKQEVQAALDQDKTFTTDKIDVRNFGADINKLGRMALIADSLQEAATATQIRDRMKTLLEPWLNGTYLGYDTTWGGVITLSSLNEPNIVISNAHYFNHLEDFGNIIYGIAAVVKKDIAFYNKHKQPILAIVRDLANPSSQDPFFPVTRQKDWYLGVSWSTGLDEFEDNRGVESSSASINGYYGVALLGKAIGYSSIYDTARLLLATEIRSSKKYFQIRADSIYPQEFAKNGMVGVLWDTKVDFITYQGDGLQFTQGNQMRPFSPITEELLDYNFTLIDYQIYATANATGSWLSYQIMDEAIIDPVAAWNRMNSTNITDWGGNSLTNALWWIATRPLPATSLF